MSTLPPWCTVKLQTHKHQWSVPSLRGALQNYKHTNISDQYPPSVVHCETTNTQTSVISTLPPWCTAKLQTHKHQRWVPSLRGALRNYKHTNISDQYSPSMVHCKTKNTQTSVISTLPPWCTAKLQTHKHQRSVPSLRGALQNYKHTNISDQYPPSMVHCKTTNTQTSLISTLPPWCTAKLQTHKHQWSVPSLCGALQNYKHTNISDEYPPSVVHCKTTNTETSAMSTLPPWCTAKLQTHKHPRWVPSRRDALRN